MSRSASVAQEVSGHFAPVAFPTADPGSRPHSTTTTRLDLPLQNWTFSDYSGQIESMLREAIQRLTLLSAPSGADVGILDTSTNVPSASSWRRVTMKARKKRIGRGARLLDGQEDWLIE